jgi:AcrR family transcriptional regulator
LSRNKILRAALALADSDGLAAVSLRKIGSSLDAGPMRLYGYVSTKEELLDLMVDAVYGEIVSAGPINGDWRAVFRTIAHRIRQACHRHPWFIALLGGRPHLGPNALAMLETALTALSTAPGFDEIDVSMRAMATVNAYVIGAVQSESSDLKSGMTKADWQTAWWPYLERVIATGRFPMLAKVVRDASHPSSDAVFDTGLETVLDGVEARLPR